MESIGVRELRRYASRWLARVKAGEAFLVTDRGRPVARLSPVGAPVGYAALVADGRIARGITSGIAEVLDSLDAEIPPDSGKSVTEALLEMRDEER